MNVEISTDRDGRVYARWHGGGPWTVLDGHGTVTTESGLAGIDEWVLAEGIQRSYESGFDDGYRGGFGDGHQAGLAEAAEKSAAESKKASAC